MKPHLHKWTVVKDNFEKVLRNTQYAIKVGFYCTERCLICGKLRDRSSRLTTYGPKAEWRLLKDDSGQIIAKRGL